MRKRIHKEPRNRIMLPSYTARPSDIDREMKEYEYEDNNDYPDEDDIEGFEELCTKQFPESSKIIDGESAFYSAFYAGEDF